MLMKNSADGNEIVAVNDIVCNVRWVLSPFLGVGDRGSAVSVGEKTAI